MSWMISSQLQTLLFSPEISLGSDERCNLSRISLGWGLWFLLNIEHFPIVGWSREYCASHVNFLTHSESFIFLTLDIRDNLSQISPTSPWHAWHSKKLITMLSGKHTWCSHALQVHTSPGILWKHPLLIVKTTLKWPSPQTLWENNELQFCTVKVP